MSYADWGHLNILRRGYKRPWLGKAPGQRVAACNSTISTNASEVQGLQEKGVIFEIGWVHPQSFRSYFAVPKSMRVQEKGKSILNFKNII